jgi:hypothetical protein
MILHVILVILVEIYKLIYKNNEWSYCYKNGISYAYSDLIKYDIKDFNLIEIFYFIILLKIFYFILKVQIFFTIFFLISNITIEERSNYFFNIFIFTPYLNSIRIKKIYKNLFNVNILKIILLNFISIKIWGYPCNTINNAYLSLLIIKSFKKDPEEVNLKKIIEIFDYIYKEVYGSSK